MGENSGKSDSTQRGSVIPCQDVFVRLKKQNEARASARRYLESARRAAIRRQVVMRVLNRDRQGPDLHLVE